MTADWENILPLTTIHIISRDISDHNPIILDTMENRERKNRSFIFKKSWLKEEDFLSRVERIWRQPIRARNSLEIVQIKLKNVKNDLKGWGKTLEGEIRI
jgi:ATP-dependent Clp protease ATP-binding subunit ClpA